MKGIERFPVVSKAPEVVVEEENDANGNECGRTEQLERRGSAREQHGCRADFVTTDALTLKSRGWKKKKRRNTFWG